MMGGEIGVTSHPGSGSTFSFTVRTELALHQTEAAELIAANEHA
jgi:hypothetical protein